MKSAQSLETIRRLEQQVLDDYRAIAGKVGYTHEMTAYIGETDNQATFQFEPPIAVRVELGQDIRPEQGLFHWCDEWLDPYWDVEIVDARHPQLPWEGLRSGYVFGPSYNSKTGEKSKRQDIEAWENVRQRLARWVRKLRPRAHYKY